MIDGTDPDVFAVDKRQHVEPSAGIVLDLLLELQTAEREVEQVVLPDDVFGPSVPSADLARLLDEENIRSPRRSFGRTACYASGDAKEFARIAELFLKRDFSQTTFKTAVL